MRKPREDGKDREDRWREKFGDHVHLRKGKELASRLKKNLRKNEILYFFVK